MFSHKKYREGSLLKIHICIHLKTGRWLGGAMVLGKLQYQGSPTNLDNTVELQRLEH